MKNVRINFHFRFILFNLKIIGEVVTYMNIFAGVPSIQQHYPATVLVQYSQTSFGPQPVIVPYQHEPAASFSSYPTEGSILYPNTGPSSYFSGAPKSYPASDVASSSRGATTSAPPPSYSAAKFY